MEGWEKGLPSCGLEGTPKNKAEKLHRAEARGKGLFPKSKGKELYNGGSRWPSFSGNGVV